MTGGPAIRRGRERPAVARLLARAYGLIVPPLRAVNAALRAATAATHHLQYKVEGLLRPSTEWFDHEIDAQWQWAARGSASFLERGVLGSLGIAPGAEVLELCCGDGFSAARFYSLRAGRVLALDHNEGALAYARRRHARPNVEYRRADVREELPAGPFDNVVWDSAIHHFTLAEAAAVLAAAHRSMRAGGRLGQDTMIEPGAGYTYERTSFDDPAELAALLLAQFPHVAVLETQDPNRRNLYFFASDVRSALPFPEGVSGSGGEAAGVDLGEEVLPSGRVGGDRSQEPS